VDLVAYWKDRCSAAETALKRARSQLLLSPTRRGVITVLADLKRGESLTTSEVAQRLNVSEATALKHLRRLNAAGFVERTARAGCHYRPVKWWLGHLVFLEELGTYHGGRELIR
jgi:DNA-binding transcriptional ArsR family regulator